MAFEVKRPREGRVYTRSHAALPESSRVKTGTADTERSLPRLTTQVLRLQPLRRLRRWSGEPPLCTGLSHPDISAPGGTCRERSRFGPRAAVPQEPSVTVRIDPLRGKSATEKRGLGPS